MVYDDDGYVQSILPLQWRLVVRQVRSLHGVNPDGQEELVKHRLEREYLLQIFIVVGISGNICYTGTVVVIFEIGNICCTGSTQMGSRPCCRELKFSNRSAGSTFCCLFRYKMGL